MHVGFVGGAKEGKAVIMLVGKERGGGGVL